MSRCGAAGHDQHQSGGSDGELTVIFDLHLFSPFTANPDAVGGAEVHAEDFSAYMDLSDDPEVAQRATRIAFAAESWQQAAMAADRWAVLAPESVPAGKVSATTW